MGSSLARASARTKRVEILWACYRHSVSGEWHIKERWVKKTKQICCPSCRFPLTERLEQATCMCGGGGEGVGGSNPGVKINGLGSIWEAGEERVGVGWVLNRNYVSESCLMCIIHQHVPDDKCLCSFMQRSLVRSWSPAECQACDSYWMSEWSRQGDVNWSYCRTKYDFVSDFVVMESACLTSSYNLQAGPSLGHGMYQ